jgi:hypothetical protein
LLRKNEKYIRINETDTFFSTDAVNIALSTMHRVCTQIRFLCTTYRQDAVPSARVNLVSDTPVQKALTNCVSLTHPKMSNNVEMRQFVSVFLIKGNGFVASLLGRQTAVGVSSPWWLTGGVDAK